jgi:CRISPR-associated protein Cas2
MKLLASYDISDDERRSRAARILLDYGQRVQDSVFWLDAEDELMDRMRARLAQIIDPKADSLWLVFVCEACVKKLVTYGIQPLPQEPESYVV